MPSPVTESYREQIRRCGRALAAGNVAGVRGDIHTDDQARQVKMFTDGNYEKRFEKVRNQVKFIEDAFGNLDELVVEYVRHQPLSAYDTGGSDGDRFLNWLEQAHRPTDEQADHIVCQRCRNAVERMARTDRQPHLRFQEVWSIADKLTDEIPHNRDLTVHLNPIRQWATFQTGALLDEDESPPANVLFYACQEEIRTAVLGLSGQALIRLLEKPRAVTFGAWLAMATEADVRSLADFCRESAAMGVLALG